MRAVVISEIDGTLKKLVWVEECRGGIYMGFYGKANKIHYSYHQNGAVHIKQGSNYLPMYKTKPINPEIIKRQKILNVIAYIVRKGAEKDCIYYQHRSYQSMKGQSFEVLNANFFKLDKFQGFLIGIILCGGK